jgi:hypothetical protein
MTLDDLAVRLAAASGEMTAIGSALSRADPGPAAFGAGDTGRLGELGRDLHRRYLAALDTRAREAAVHAARLSTVADAVAQAAAGYAEADRAAVDRAAVDRAGAERGGAAS